MITSQVEDHKDGVEDVLEDEDDVGEIFEVGHVSQCAGEGRPPREVVGEEDDH